MVSTTDVKVGVVIVEVVVLAVVFTVVTSNSIPVE